MKSTPYRYLWICTLLDWISILLLHHYATLYFLGKKLDKIWNIWKAYLSNYCSYKKLELQYFGGFVFCLVATFQVRRRPAEMLPTVSGTFININFVIVTYMPCWIRLAVHFTKMTLSVSLSVKDLWPSVHWNSRVCLKCRKLPFLIWCLRHIKYSIS